MNAALLTSGRHVSMDAPLVEDEDSCLLDLMTCRDADAADSTLVSDSLKEEVQRAINMLPERKHRLLKCIMALIVQRWDWKKLAKG